MRLLPKLFYSLGFTLIVCGLLLMPQGQLRADDGNPFKPVPCSGCPFCDTGVSPACCTQLPFTCLSVGCTAPGTAANPCFGCACVQGLLTGRCGCV